VIWIVPGDLIPWEVRRIAMILAQYRLKAIV